MEYQLELKDIVKEYGEFRAVDHVNVQIEKGEIITFLGPSGCGKTTTLRMVAGLIRPTSGEIHIVGEDITNVPPYKRDISMVFQNYALFPNMNVFDNVVYGLKTRKIRDKKVLKEKAEEMLEIVQLSGLADRFPRQLSGGQQQRVSLARALIVNPRVMLFDEPLSNLDAKLRVQTRIEIRQLLKRLNITAIYVTHDQEEALTISDRIAVMNAGRIEQITTPRELYSNPCNRFVADFVGQSNLFSGTVSSVEGGSATVLTEGGLSIVGVNPEGRWKAGDKVTVMSRLEDVKIGAAGAKISDVNTYNCTVEAKSFLGSVVRYTLKLSNGKEITVAVHPDNDVPVGTHDTLLVSWAPEQVHILPE